MSASAMKVKQSSDYIANITNLQYLDFYKVLVELAIFFLCAEEFLKSTNINIY
jgi:hypothetical protein